MTINWEKVKKALKIGATIAEVMIIMRIFPLGLRAKKLKSFIKAAAKLRGVI